MHAEGMNVDIFIAWFSLMFCVRRQMKRKNQGRADLGSFQVRCDLSCLGAQHGDGKALLTENDSNQPTFSSTGMTSSGAGTVMVCRPS